MIIFCQHYPLSLLDKTGAAMASSRRVEWRQAPTEPGLSVDRDISQPCIAIPSAGDDNFIYIGGLVRDATCTPHCSVQSRKYEFIKNIKQLNFILKCRIQNPIILRYQFHCVSSSIIISTAAQ